MSNLEGNSRAHSRAIQPYQGSPGSTASKRKPATTKSKYQSFLKTEKLRESIPYIIN
jgi:hypothetical protein